MDNMDKKTGDEMFKAFLGFDLNTLVKEMEEISGSWNGDNPGLGEDRAHCADEIIIKAKELKELLDEMETYY